ncbi:MAG: FtsX-like permease family protein [Bacteroidota bacterium]
MINILGLSLGLAGFVFIILFINHEKSYDTWVPALKNIYQVQEYTDYYPVEEEFKWKDNMDRRLSTIFSSRLPQAEALTMVEKETEKGLTIAGKYAVLQNGLRRSDSLFFKVMPYKFKYGSAETAFKRPFAIVLKSNLAEKLYGTSNPVGKSITISARGKGSEKTYVVTGVVEVPHTPSSINFEAIYIDDGADFRFGAKFDPAESAEIYVKMASTVNFQNFNNVLQSAYLPIKDKQLKQFNSSLAEKLKAQHQPKMRLVPLARIHQNPLEGKSWKEKMNPVLILSILLLLVSIVNFINLATAQATSRAKEIGIKKVIGAQKNTLILQFLTETLMQCIIAMFLSLFLIELSLPTLNHYFSLTLSIFNGNGLLLVMQLTIIVIVVALLTGLYPSFFLSSYQPKQVLKGNFFTSSKGAFIRKGLVGLQFVVTISFIVGILVISYQVNYLKTRDNGFSGTTLLNVRANFSNDKQGYNRLKKIDGVQYVGFSSGVIGSNQPSGYNFRFEDQSRELQAIGLNMEGLQALNARLLEGRFFSKSIAGDTINNVMLNEAAVNVLSRNIIGKQLILRDSIALNIIGVIKNIQVAGFDKAVKPSVYIVQSSITDSKIGTYYTPSTLIKFESSKLEHVTAELEKIFVEKNSFYPLKYSVVQDDIAMVLAEHERFEKMVALFSILSLGLSLFGLFALAAFITKQRTKEIAVRKVFGAENSDILILLNKGYIWIVLIANGLSFPIVYVLMSLWLSEFAYRIELTPLPFLLAFLVSILITIITVSFQAYKAVRTNPIKALKYE